MTRVDAPALRPVLVRRLATRLQHVTRCRDCRRHYLLDRGRGLPGPSF